MTLGPLMIDIETTTISAEDRDILTHPLVGGVILFSRNFEDPDQLLGLCEGIHALRKPSLLIAVDQEGGRVQRFKDDFTTLPAVREVGHQWDIDQAGAKASARALGWLMAAELRACGVDFSFAPVLDLDWGLSAVIGDRAFGRDPELVTQLARAYIRGMHEAGMAAVGKHFPGHGAVTTDSHHALPRDRRNYGDVLEDMQPFQRLSPGELDGVMTAHVVYTELDLLPASFSSYWIKQELRGNLGFTGVVFSDDLSMEGAAGIGDLAERANAALEAGSDMVLVCNDRPGAIKVIEELGAYVNPPSALRLTKMHGRECSDRATLFGGSRWRDANRLVNQIRSKPGLTLDA